MTRSKIGDGTHPQQSTKAQRAEVAFLASRTSGASPRASAVDIDEFNGPLAAPRSLARRATWWFCYLTAWLVALSLGVVAALRVFDHDGSFLLIWVNAFTRYVYLPIYACLAWSAWQRRWLLASASALVVGCHILWMAPDFLRDRRFDLPAEAAAADPGSRMSPPVRIFFANVAAANSEHDALLHEIAAADPDVIVLLEFSWPWHLKFKTASVLVPYIYGSGHLQSHIGSVNVFSRLPLKKEIQKWVGGRAVHTIDVELGTEALRIIGLHGPRPIDDPRYNYVNYWKDMVPLLTAGEGARVIVGDFNVTEHSLVYQQLKSGQLRTAHDDRGRGYATTWPNGQNWLPPIRIDQVWLSPEVECEQIVEGRGRGSDHKPLIVDVRIRHPRPR